MQEQARRLLEFLGILGGKIVYGAILRTLLLHLGMAVEIVEQTAGDILALRHDADAWIDIFDNLWHEQRIMGTAEDYGVDVGVKMHQLVDALLDEIVGSGTVRLIVFDKRNPEGTRHAGYRYVGILLLYLEVITLALDGSLSGKDSHMT